MEWAIAHGARVVNLSLGATDEPGLDPLEEAVNTLSAQHGTLFVIAAGNAGFTARSVNSPSSADAALSVGAVDSRDRRAVFSGLGPRVGDGAIKPDVMAPGVGIVAARAASTQAGPPVGESYTRLSGTSMATPHVAGAAALLLQQHPQWSGEQLKEALMGSAQPTAALTVYEQGAGRIDLDRATAQHVLAQPPALSFGVASYPHEDDAPLSRSVRYSNAGAEPVTLALTAALTSPGGAPAPAGMVTVIPASLVVPAGGTAEAVVTIDTRIAGADGLYGGALIATSGAERIRTLLGVDREPESYDLTVRVVGADGQPGEGLVEIWGVDEPGTPVAGVAFFSVVSGEAKVRVPVGTYVVTSLDGDAWLVAPRLPVTADTTLSLDARLARPQQLTLPDAGLVHHLGTMEFEDARMLRGLSVSSAAALGSAQLGPEPAPGEVYALINALYGASVGPFPVSYHLAHLELDRFPTGWRRTFRRDELAQVEARHAGPAGHLLTKVQAAIPPVNGFIAGLALPASEGAFRRTEYYYGPQFGWYVGLEEGVAFPSPPGGVRFLAGNDTLRDYGAGQRYRESWNQGPLGPAFAEATLFGVLGDYSGEPRRYRQFLVLAPSMFSDQAVPARNGVSFLEEGSLTLFRNGELLAQAPAGDLRLTTAIGAEPAQYRLEAVATRPAELFDRSTHVTASWSFRAQAGDDIEVLPLPSLRFFPLLDDQDRSAAPALLLPMEIERPSASSAPAIAAARIDVSFDDGATWSRVPALRLGDRVLGLVTHRRGATHVSLRGTASDVEGNAVEQTIVRAYAFQLTSISEAIGAWNL
jgi:hypothetical protein